jgi:DNA-binding transcriptional MerR regulator
MAKSPDAFRTISEVAIELDVPQHVLRFWETKFSQIKPLKRAGGRRYYRPEDVDLLRGIRIYLYTEGFTIKGVQKIFREQGARLIVEAGKNDGIAHVPRGSKRAAAPPALPPAPASTAQAPKLPKAAGKNGAEPVPAAVESKSLTALLAELTEAKALLARTRALRPVAPTPPAAAHGPKHESRRA